MFTTPVKEIMDKRKLLLAEPTMTVKKAAEAMAKRGVGAALVVEDHKLVGILPSAISCFAWWRGLDSTKTTLAEVMTREPKTITPDKSYGVAMLLMHENKFRHLPVVDNDVPIGIVSSRSALDPELEEFVFEERRRKHLQEMR